MARANGASSTWAPEVAVWFEINGGRRILTTCTPDDLQAHAAGYLLTEGYITSASEISGTTVVDSPWPGAGVRVTVPEPGVVRVGKLHRHIRENGCGLMHYATCDRSVLCAERALEIPREEVFRELFRALFAAGDEAYPSGGMHTAALTDGARILVAVHDVGRHNAVDKVIGRGMLAAHDLSRCGLMLTARISGAIAVKAARSGVAWIASRSMPTTLAVAIADAAQLPIVARAPSKDAVTLGGTSPAGTPLPE
jgi:FdhD protein